LSQCWTLWKLSVQNFNLIPSSGSASDHTAAEVLVVSRGIKVNSNVVSLPAYILSLTHTAHRTLFQTLRTLNSLRAIICVLDVICEMHNFADPH
jgi:hypothetical protein